MPQMTEADVIKALECCMFITPNKECGECPKSNDGDRCSVNLHRSALDLINRKDQRIAELEAEVEKLKGYNENLLTANTALSNELLEAKSEAYRELAKYLTKHIKDELEQCGNPNHDTQPIAYGTVLGLKGALSFVETAPIILESKELMKGGEQE